ncbi:MAG: serine dehydratase beta chain, partial [Pseudomonadota bacterium]
MFLSIFDIFKIGIGPSSSHTMGPMVAAARFLRVLKEGERIPGASDLARLGCRLHGSLAFTGHGHATDRAVILGLAGFEPATIEAGAAEAALETIRATKRIQPPGLGDLAFDPDADLIFDYGPPLPLHANAMVLSAWDAEGNLFQRETYYSIGGGFVQTEAEMKGLVRLDAVDAAPDVPYPFTSAEEMLAMAAKSGLSIAEMKRANEEHCRSRTDLNSGLDRIWQVMTACIERGLARDGILPGGLNVRRRAKSIHDQLLAERTSNLQMPHVANDWLSVYAMAVNE